MKAFGEDMLDQLIAGDSVSDEHSTLSNPRHSRQKAPLPRSVMVAATVAAIGTFSFGYTLSFTSPALLGMEVLKSDSVFGTYKVEDHAGTVTITDENGEWFSAVANLGGLVGSLCGGVLNERFGRRNTLIFLAIPLLASWLWISVTDNFVQLIVARIMTGVAVGIATLTVPMYIGEISPAVHRGTLGSLTQFMTTFGILFVNVLAIAVQSNERTSVTCPEFRGSSYGHDIKECSDIVPSWKCDKAAEVCRGDFANWRFLALGGAVVALVLLMLMPWMPESPVYLARRDSTKARAALCRLRGPDDDIDAELDAILRETGNDAPTQPASSGQGKSSALSVLMDSRRALVIGLTILAFQQLSGVNAIIFYATSILQSAGVQDSQVGAILTFAVQFLFTGLAVFLMDRAGRRPLLISSSLSMAVFCMTMGLFFANGKHPSWLALVSLMGYIAAFSIAMGPVPWIIMSEVFPSEARSLAGSMATALNWLLAFLVTKFYSPLSIALTAAVTFWIFSGLCMCCFFFTVFNLPETKGKSFEQIQRELKGNGPQSEAEDDLLG